MYPPLVDCAMRNRASNSAPSVSMAGLFRTSPSISTCSEATTARTTELETAADVQEPGPVRPKTSCPRLRRRGASRKVACCSQTFVIVVTGNHQKKSTARSSIIQERHGACLVNSILCSNSVCPAIWQAPGFLLCSLFFGKCSFSKDHLGRLITVKRELFN